MTESVRRGTYEVPIDVDNRNDWGVEESRKPLNEATHGPGYFYTSPEVYALEKERIFMADWLAVGRVEEVEKPGDFRTYRICEEPIVVTRNKDGEIKAFMNRCAHRGVRVAEGSGNAREFMCPYHGWLYDLDGRLVGAPFMDKAVDFDRKNCRLKPLPIGIWAGWIFTTFNDAPTPFEAFIAPYDRELGFLKQEECRLAEKIVIEVNCNWKFPVENLMDNYHSRVLHVKSIGPTMGVERFTGHRHGSKAFTAYYDARPMTADGKSRFGRMPWMEEKSERFACSAHIAPHMHLFARSDNVHPFLMWPLGVDRVRIECYQLFPKEWHADADFERKVKDYTAFTSQVVHEDASVMESLHDAASSKRFQPGRMSRLELGVWNVVNYNVDRVLGVGDAKLYEE
jgi:Rieske 2Fe-2S family protein